MANLNLKHSTRPDRANVEKYVKNSLEYQNPNLRGPSSKFPPMTQAEKSQLSRLQVFEKLLRTYTHPDLQISAQRLLSGEKGFFCYMTRINGKIDWTKEETRIEFDSFNDLIDKLYEIVYSCLIMEGHISMWTSMGIKPEYFPSIRPVAVNEHPHDYGIEVGGVPVVQSYWLNDQLFIIEKVYDNKNSAS